MLPEFLAGSYQRYKADTNAFTTWLYEAAIASGYRLPNSKVAQKENNPPLTASVSPPAPALTYAEKLRAKQRVKEAKKKEKKQPAVESQSGDAPAVKHVVAASEILEQAKIVSKNPKIQVPDAILHIVSRAVRARQRCTDWFKNTNAENGHSNEGHLHFIGVLHEAIKVLRPGYDYTLLGEPISVPKQSPPTDLAGVFDSDMLADLKNRFSALEVEDTEDIMEPEVHPPTPPNITSKGSRTSRPLVYELELEDFIDWAFHAFCFFEDLHRIQSFLAETWRKYKSGEIDLITAALTTNAAFAVARREETKVMENGFDDKSLSYEKIAARIWPTHPFNNSCEIRGPKAIKYAMTPFDSFIFLAPARTLEKYEKCTCNYNERDKYPQLVTSLTLQNPHKDPSLQKIWDTLEAEDRFTTQYLIDMNLLRMMTKENPELVDIMVEEEDTNPALDEFSYGFDILVKDRQISTWFVFANQILLDIQDILGSRVPNGWQELRILAEKAKETIGINITSKGKFVGDDWMMDMGRDATIRVLIGQSFLNPPAYQEEKNELVERAMARKEKAQREAKESGGSDPYEGVVSVLGFIVPYVPIAEENAFLYAHNPIYCGFRAFQLALEMEQMGLNLEFKKRYIFDATHLYNAALKFSGCNIRWPAMDHFIEVQKTSLFAGVEPTNEKEFFTRWLLQSGGSPVNVALVGRRVETRRKARTHRGARLKLSKMSEIYSRYFLKYDTSDQTLHQLENLIVKSTRPEIRSSGGVPQALTSVQFLSKFRDYLQASLKDIMINYLELEEQSLCYLVHMKATLEETESIFDTPSNLSLIDSFRSIALVSKILQPVAVRRAFLDNLTKKEYAALMESDALPKLQLYLCGEIQDAYLTKALADGFGEDKVKFDAWRAAMASRMLEKREEWTRQNGDEQE